MKVPDSFGIGLASLVPKFKGLKKSVAADDFRAIRVNPIISKIFEHCMADYIHFKNNTSTKYFGFKKNVGCINSIHTLRKRINYFVTRNSTVSIANIDLKKAFDKCNTYGTLCALQKRKVDFSVINVLENWCSKNCLTVK